MANSRTDLLPDFEHPPLDEVALSIQFADLPLKNHHAGLLWLKLRDMYPKVEEQAPLKPVFETFGAMRPASAELNIELLPAEAMIRYWFVSDDDDELLQFQRDRLIHNWRSHGATKTYPRYESLRPRFESDVERVKGFLQEYQLGEIQCNQCEVTYVNAIGPNTESEDPTRDFDKIFTVWCERYCDDELSHIERARFSASFLMPRGAGGEPLGRIHITADPAIRRCDSAPMIRLNITARGKPRDETVAAAFEWLDQGHISVVRSFAAITTKRMHKVWGRRDI